MSRTTQTAWLSVLAIALLFGGYQYLRPQNTIQPKTAMAADQSVATQGTTTTVGAVNAKLYPQAKSLNKNSGTSTTKDLLSQTQGLSSGDASTTQDYEVFRQKFAKCEPAEAKASLGGSVVYQYDIIGPQGAYCRITSQFIGIPNPAWVGKTMTCLYDNTKPLETAVADVLRDMNNCSGPLYDILVPEHSAVAGCTLRAHYGDLTLLKGVGMGLEVEGYAGDGSKVAWQSKNPSIANLKTNTGKSVMVQSLSAGKTEIVVTDNAGVPNCKITIPVTIKQ